MESCCLEDLEVRSPNRYRHYSFVKVRLDLRHKERYPGAVEADQRSEASCQTAMEGLCANEPLGQGWEEAWGLRGYLNAPDRVKYGDARHLVGCDLARYLAASRCFPSSDYSWSHRDSRVRLGDAFSWC